LRIDQHRHGKNAQQRATLQLVLFLELIALVKQVAASDWRKRFQAKSRRVSSQRSIGTCWTCWSISRSLTAAGRSTISWRPWCSREKHHLILASTLNAAA